MSPTPDNFKNLMRIAMGCDDLRVDKHVMRLVSTHNLQRYFRDNGCEPWNLCWFDFIDFDPTFIGFLIGLNFTKELTILRGRVKLDKRATDLDVGDKLRMLMSRGNSLYLVSIWKDLGLNGSSGDLEIVFKFGSERVQYHNIRFEREDSYLLNYLTYLKYDGGGLICSSVATFMKPMTRRGRDDDDGRLTHKTIGNDSLAGDFEIFGKLLRRR